MLRPTYVFTFVLARLARTDLAITQSNEIYALLDAARRQGPAESAKTFRDSVLPRFQPCVFHEWFFQMWPEPTAWFAARLAYARTLGVMSMVGFVLG
jgi:serine/threonine-protein kinase ATR